MQPERLRTLWVTLADWFGSVCQWADERRGML